MTAHINALKQSSNVKSLNFLWLELTEKCNLFCVHCYNDSSPHKSLKNKMEYEDWLRVLEESFAAGCRSIQFIGGEAVMHPDLIPLIIAAKNIGFEFIELFTNLTIVNDRLLKAVMDNKVSVATSFYSHERKIHEAITQRAGSFDKTVKGISKVLEKGIPLRVGIIKMNENPGQTDQTIEYLKKLGLSEQNIGTDEIRKYGRGSCSSNEYNTGFEDLCGQCGNGKLCVTSSGLVHPCIMSRMVIAGNVLENSIDYVIHSRELSLFKSEIQKESNFCGPSCNPERCGPQQHCYPHNNDCNPQVCTPHK